MRITLISFYLRNSLFCRSHASSCSVQQFRNLAAGNIATTVEENEEEPWVDPYNKALPEKKETFSDFREAKVDWSYVERLLPREFVPERKVGGYITPSGWRAPRENPPDLPYYIARGIDNMPRIFLELRRDELNPKTMDFEHVDVVVLREIYGDIFACERDLRDGREVPFDLEWMTHQEIGDVLRKTLGKSTLVRKAEELEKMAKCHPADFGENCQRQCICEVQGQHPCTSLIYAPKHISESWRCDHENYNPEEPKIYPKQKFVDSDLVERDPPGRQ